MRIGLIGGIGPAATQHYYRCLVRGAAARGIELEILISHASMATLGGNLAAMDTVAQGEDFADHARRLAAAGAEAVAITSLSGHFAAEALAAKSPIPVLNGLPALDARFRALGLGRVGLIGSRQVMASRLYGKVTSAALLAPEEPLLTEVDAAYMAMAAAAQATPDQEAVFLKAGAAMTEAGADAILLAGTDLFLVFDRITPPFTAIDGASVHCDAIMDVMEAGRVV